jgi:hypothetical protein
MKDDMAIRPGLESSAQPINPLHGLPNRQESYIPAGEPVAPGRFGRLMSVPVRPPRRYNRVNAALEALATTMIDDGAPSGDNPTIPSGFTYFGQFVDHDMTYDTTSVPEQQVDLEMVYNYRTPKLDLDCLYGLGPAASPYLYQRDNRAKFLLGVVADARDLQGTPLALPDEGRYDLPRNSEGYALIGDPRNDENLIISQIHLAFLKFHNAVADEVEPDPSRQIRSFDKIRREVTWHYQWMVMHDLLERIANPDDVRDVLDNGRRIYRFNSDPFIPVEFSVAAYRFGHSMVRESYDYNRYFGPGAGRIAPATLDNLFFFTGPRKERPAGKSMQVSSPLPSNWVIDFCRFFEVGSFARRNLSRLIDTRLSPTLHHLPAGKVADLVVSLPLRSLRRGEAVGLPSGQRLAARLQIPPLEPDEIAQSGPDGEVAAQYGLLEQTPLWYYLLKEAELRANGRRLGPLGSRIVAEVFVGLLQGDSLSYLSSEPNWTPWLQGASEGKGKKDFRFADMLYFLERKAPIINPLGE